MVDCFAILNEILSNESPWVTNQDSWDKYIKTLQSKKANISSKEELNDLGCNSSGDIGCTAAPDWTYSTSYWTGSAGAVKAIYRVHSDGTFKAEVHSGRTRGIRPVIVIDKSLVK